MGKIKFYIHPADKAGVDITRFWDKRVNGKLTKVESCAFWVLFPTKDCDKYIYHVCGESDAFAKTYDEALKKAADILNYELDMKTFEYFRPGYEFIKTDEPWPKRD